MNDGKINIVLNREQAVNLMNLLAIQSESLIFKQYNYIKESYSGKDAVTKFEHDYPNISINGMAFIADTLFSKLNDCLNPDNMTIDLT